MKLQLPARTGVFLFVMAGFLCQQIFAQDLAVHQTPSEKTVHPERVGLTYHPSNVLDPIQGDTALPYPSRRPTSGKIMGQFFGGVMMGGISGILGGLIGVKVFKCEGYFCEFGEFMIGASVGYVVGSSYGVYAIGDDEYQTASYSAVILGDMIGFGVGYVILDQVVENSTAFTRVLGGCSHIYIAGSWSHPWLLFDPTISGFRPEQLVDKC